MPATSTAYSAGAAPRDGAAPHDVVVGVAVVAGRAPLPCGAQARAGRHRLLPWRSERRRRAAEAEAAGRLDAVQREAVAVGGEGGAVLPAAAPPKPPPKPPVNLGRRLAQAAAAFWNAGVLNWPKPPRRRFVPVGGFGAVPVGAVPCPPPPGGRPCPKLGRVTPCCLRHEVYLAKAAPFAPRAAPAADVVVFAVVLAEVVAADDPPPPHAATAQAVVTRSAATAPR